MNDVHMKFDKWKYVSQKRIFQPEMLVTPIKSPRTTECCLLEADLCLKSCWTESGLYHGNDSNGLF